MGRYKHISLLFTLLFVAVASITSLSTTKVNAQGQIEPWCGATSGAKNYGFTMPLDQYHWTVNSEPFGISEAAINEVDTLFDKLNADNIANTMILFIDSNEVALGPTCAGDFLIYMGLGNDGGERDANGMSIVFIVTKANDSVTGVKVQYSRGGSLTAFQPVDLKEMDVIAQNTFVSTGSLEETYLTVMRYFEQYARSKYEPYYPPTPTDQPQTLPTPINRPLGPVGLCLTCIVIFLILAFLYWLFKNVKLTGTGTYTPHPYNGGNHSTGSNNLGQSRQQKSTPKGPTRRGGGSGNTNTVG